MEIVPLHQFFIKKKIEMIRTLESKLQHEKIFPFFFQIIENSQNLLIPQVENDTHKNSLKQENFQKLDDSRTITLEQLINLICKNNINIVIEGKYGSGKTTILSELKKLIWSLKIEIDGQKYLPIELFEQDFIENKIDILQILQKEDYSFNKNMLNCLLNEIQQGKIQILLIIDNCEQIAQTLNSQQIDITFSTQSIGKYVSTITSWATDQTNCKQEFKIIQNSKPTIFVRILPINQSQVDRFLGLFFQKKLKKRLEPQFNKFQDFSIFNQVWEALEIQIQQIELENFTSVRLFQESSIQTILQQFDQQEILNIQQIVESWIAEQPSLKQCEKFLNNLDLNELLQTPEIMNVIFKLLPSKKEMSMCTGKHRFYENFIFQLIKNKIKRENLSNQFNQNDPIEQCLKFLEGVSLYQKEIQLPQQLHKLKFMLNSIAQYQQIKGFFVSKYINQLLSQKINIQEKKGENFSYESYIEYFLHFKNQCLFGQISLTKESLVFLKEICEQNEAISQRLILIIQASAAIDNFSQEASNAMEILNAAETNIRWQDFQGINIKNCKIDRLKFFDCNFFNSQMNNVDITYTQFINCKIENVQWNLSTKSEFFELSNPTGDVTSICFSPNGKTVACGDVSNVIRLWNLKTREEIGVLEGLQQPIKLMKFWKEEKLLLSISHDAKIQFWNTQGQKINKNIKTKFNLRHCMAASFTTKAQLVATSHLSTKIWNLTNGKLLRQLDRNSYIILTITFSQDNSLIALGKDNYMISLLQLKSGYLIRNSKHCSAPQFLKFSSDCKYLVCANRNLSISIISINNLREIKKFNNNSLGLLPLALSSKEPLLATGCLDTVLRLKNLQNGSLIQVQNTQSSKVTLVEFSPNGKILASCSNSKIRFEKINKEIHNQIQKGHQNLVLSAVFSPNQLILASYDKNNTILLWNVKSGKVVQIIHYPNGCNREMINQDLQFSLDGQFLGFVLGSDKICLWNINLSKQTQVLKYNNYEINCFKFSPDCITLISCLGIEQNAIIIWNVQSGEIIQVYNKSQIQGILTIGFSEDGKILAFCVHKNGSTSLWNIREGTEFKLQKDQRKSANTNYTISSNFTIFAFVINERSIGLFSIKDSKQKLIKNNEKITSLVFSYNEQLLASTNNNRNITIWRVNDGQKIQIIRGIDRVVDNRFTDFSQDGQLFAITHKDFSISIWSLRGGKTVQELNGYISLVQNISVMPDGQILKNKEISDYDQINLGEKHSISMSISKNEILAQTFIDNLIILWNIKERKLISKLQCTKQTTNAVCISHNEALLASGSSDCSVYLWDLNSYRLIAQLKEHQGEVYSILFSNDDSILISGSKDGSICFWDIKNQKLLQRKQNYHQDAIYSLTISSNNYFLASGSRDQTVNLLEINKENQIIVICKHEDSVNQVIFSPDDKLLASASSDKTIKIIEANTGNLLHQLKGHSDKVNSVAFSTNLRLIISGSDDQTVRLWNMNNGLLFRCISDIKKIITSVLFIQENQFIAYGTEGGKIRIEKVSSDYNFETEKLFSPYTILANSQFRVKECLVNHSNIKSIKGTNLMNMFSNYQVI